ncbi:MAG: LamG domain-containing protein, partial [Chitinophagia bacterium]|nr:LamG domain-containing protein [Chitinophagia bacterium]
MLLSNIVYSQSIPSYVPTSGLVGWWGFNGNAQDGSGNGNHGTVNGATLTTDRFGNQNSAYDFDGINDNISFSNVPFVNQITISFWINIPFDGGGITIVQNSPFFPYNTSFATSSRPSNYHQYILYSNNCPLTTQNYYLNQSGSIVNSWHNLIYTIDNNSDCRLYYDGLFQGLYDGSNFENCSNSNTNLRFGGNWVTHDPQWFKGNLDDLGIWNRALTQQEITNLYNSQLPTQTSLCLPTITTTSPSSVGVDSVVIGGNITNDGGSSIVLRGVCYSTSPNPNMGN